MTKSSPLAETFDSLVLANPRRNRPLVSLDGLVPKDRLLRKIEAAIDFSFIHDRVAGLYCADNGRPPVDPMILSPLGSFPDEARPRPD